MRKCCLIILLLLFGCAKEPVSYSSDGNVLRNVRVLKESYFSVKQVEAEVHNSLLDTKLTLRSKGSLPHVAKLIMEIVPVRCNVISENELQRKELLPGDYPANLDINHQGPLKDLLEQIAAQSGYGYEVDGASKTITFARTLVRTFVLKAAPGKVNFSTQLTNRSRESSGREFVSNVNATQMNSASQAQISQTYQGSFGFDVWQDTLNTVRTMLSPIGQAQGNLSAGSIVVRDRPQNLPTIGRYIDQVNILYGKQVALRVNVYSLELRQEQSVGFDLSTILPSLDLGATKIAAQLGAITTPTGSLGSATATILNGQLKNSQAILTALQKVGRAKQITSAGIVCLNNQPAPVEAIKKIAYLAGSSVESTDSGTETELTPGEVTTGFSMTITPHILSNRQVVLQYSVHLSNLDSLEAIESNNTKIQLPHVSTRAFAQKASMLMGQTLVLAGFEQATRQEQKKFGLLSLSKNQDLTKSLIIITIEVENADTWA